ncbi:D-xylose ABC transporter substrate-binding protein [Pokkaliibacter plantistimulans]|uniref:D-xylose ABC transporter substrate-binding protein n=1 Tax=Pokkaliibacter plantistimulans TaxID=1635171 RepID=UPI000D743479|nr:D-xylose ABC transporter substrate-binding protein [Pokkaliibacter plantistimulans]
MKPIKATLKASVKAVACAVLLAGVSVPAWSAVKIGMAIDDLRLERWQKDRDFFVAQAEKLGASVDVQSANGNEQTQIAQIENMISKGVNVLVIIPYNGEVLSNVIAEAKSEGIKVLAYDRLIKNADIDFYVSFDNEKVGEIQAEALLSKQPKGKYFLMGGSPVDNNAHMFRDGQMKVLKPAIDRGDITVVGDQWVDSWLAENALKIMENALTANHNQIDAVVASNDSTAGGAIQALQAQGLAGKVAISGQDADVAALKRIIAGTQTMTVYKPINKLATEAATVAVALGDDKAPESNATLNNGSKDVPSYLLDPIAVDNHNLQQTVVADGFVSQAALAQ